MTVHFTKTDLVIHVISTPPPAFNNLAGIQS